jgi:hypothetical protein
MQLASVDNESNGLFKNLLINFCASTMLVFIYLWSENTVGNAECIRSKGV